MNLTIILSSTTDISEHLIKLKEFEPIYIFCDYDDVSIFAQNLVVSPQFQIEGSIVKKCLGLKTLDIAGNIKGFDKTFKDIMRFEKDVIGLTNENEIVSLTTSKTLMVNIEQMSVGD